MENNNNNNNNSFEEKAKEILNDVADNTSNFSSEEIESGKGLSVISYIGALALVPFFAEKNNKYVVYNAKQGLNLFIIEIIISFGLGIINMILRGRLGFIIGLLETVFSICSFALSIIGIINVVNGKAKELPIVNKFKIIK